jgi:biotin synthase
LKRLKYYFTFAKKINFMRSVVDKLINTGHASKEEIALLLQCKENERTYLLEKSKEIKEKYIGNKVFFRGLIEFSNVCAKNCYYCGIRRDNKKLERYTIEDNEVIEAAKFAHEKNYGSIVLQAGEISSPQHIHHITRLIKEIKKLSDGKLGITLSLGEQTEETYKEWFDAGAHRYLLRIEASNKDLYLKLHPNDTLHDYDIRKNALYNLKKIGYQVGTGVMIGLPFQTYQDLANDLLFMKELDIDMCGMGPYIEHTETPLYQYKDTLMPLEERYDLTLKMIAILRIMMKDVNIASTTALQAIDPIGREKAITIGANIIMPNITPKKYRDKYFLYENKPCSDEDAEDCIKCLEMRIKFAGGEIGYGEWGDSLHFKNKS